MANLDKRSMKLMLEDGKKANGETRTKARTFSKLSKGADEAALAQAAGHLAGFYQAKVHEVRLIEESILEAND